MSKVNSALIDQLMHAGLAEDEAIGQARRVLDAVAQVVIAGASVKVPGICTLKGHVENRRIWGPGQLGRKARKETTLRIVGKPKVLWAGAEFDCDLPEKQPAHLAAIGRPMP